MGVIASTRNPGLKNDYYNSDDFFTTERLCLKSSYFIHISSMVVDL